MVPLSLGIPVDSVGPHSAATALKANSRLVSSLVLRLRWSDGLEPMLTSETMRAE